MLLFTGKTLLGTLSCSLIILLLREVYSDWRREAGKNDFFTTLRLNDYTFYNQQYVDLLFKLTRH